MYVVDYYITPNKLQPIIPVHYNKTLNSSTDMNKRT